MRFTVSDCLDLESSYLFGSWVKPGGMESRSDIYRLFFLEGTNQEFNAAAKRMRKPGLRSRLRGLLNSKPLVPYAAIWRNEHICTELEIGAVCIQSSLSLIFFGPQDQVRMGDEIELMGIEPRRHGVSIRVVIFKDRNVLPVGMIWGTDWVKSL